MILFKAVFMSVFKRRDVKILLSFIILPILAPVLAGISEQQLDQNIFGSFLNFFGSAIETQYQLVLPAIIAGFIVSSVFHDEIASGTMFLYKDLKRSRIFNAKLLSLLAVYGIYWLGTFITALGTYIFYILPKTKSSFQFFLTADIDKLVLQVLSITAIYLILITIVAAVSIKKATLGAVLAGVLFNIVAQTAPLLNGFRYIFPNTYPRLLGKLDFWGALLISMGISVSYFIIAYAIARRRFQNIEY